MRRIIIVLAGAVLAAAPIPGWSQGADDHTVLGLYLGASVSTLHGVDVPGPTHTSGFAVGAFARWGLGDHFAFQPELQFIQKGDNQVDIAGTQTFTTALRLSYVEVPLLFRLRGEQMGGLVPFLVVGPALAVRAGCSVDVRGLAGSYSCNNLPERESLDYGAIAGGGVDLTVGGRTFTISARYDWGVKDAFRNNDAKNRALSVLLGIRLW
ncbi:MAG: porin family protein [Gemmatimonadales bacterium]